MKNTIFTILFCFIGSNTFAAPIPGTGASQLIAPELGIYRSPHGFQVSKSTTDWIQTRPPKSSKHIATVYRSPKVSENTRASLTVRVDQLKNNMPLDKYVGRWVKEYPKFGFDVLGKKVFKLKNNDGYVIDLVNNKKHRKIRQVVFKKDKVAVIMTCRDHQKTFSNSLKDCNNIVRSFDWGTVNQQDIGNKLAIPKIEKSKKKLF